MNTLTFSVFSNKLLEVKHENIPYQEKQSFIYFEIEETKYFLYKNLSCFKYQTQEEKVNMNFKDKIVNISLISYSYTLDIKINKFMYETTKNTYKITYVLDSEPDVTKTFFITL